MLFGYNVLCFETMYKFLFCLFYKKVRILLGRYLTVKNQWELITGDGGNNSNQRFFKGSYRVQEQEKVTAVCQFFLF